MYKTFVIKNSQLMEGRDVILVLTLVFVRIWGSDIILTGYERLDNKLNGIAKTGFVANERKIVTFKRIETMQFTSSDLQVIGIYASTFASAKKNYNKSSYFTN